MASPSAPNRALSDGGGSPHGTDVLMTRMPGELAQMKLPVLGMGRQLGKLNVVMESRDSEWQTIAKNCNDMNRTQESTMNTANVVVQELKMH